MRVVASLRELEVLALDCQSTGASPRHGHLLEIAWSKGRAGAASWSCVASHLVRLPRGQRVPSRIRRLTGIREEDMVAALPAPAVRRRLEADLSPAPVAVAHFARFESTFLDSLCGGRFPLDMLCTHEIACRLLPGLPRRGLRALAGYLGHPMHEDKRAAQHVAATVAVWRALVERLEEEGVTTLAELHDWMERVAPARTGGREYPLARETRLALPDAPGVYRFLGKHGDLLYVGKAKSLKARVNSYFRQRRHGTEKTPELLTRAFDVRVTVTPTALEAALAEADAIKEESPPYNTALREGRTDVHFASPDFADVARTPDADHPVGPLPRADALVPLVALRPDAVDLGAPVWDRLRGMPVEAGYARFRERNGCGDPVRLGARLWTREVPEEGDDDEPDDVERVARHFESSLRHAVHMLRRARWLTRISEGVLVWRHRVLQIAGGRIGSWRPDYLRSARERHMAFDAATYDRLRVLTTEIRRVAEHDPIALRLGPGTVYGRAALRRKLRWL